MGKGLTKYQLRRQPAPLLDLDYLENDKVDDLQRLILENAQDFLPALATRKFPAGVDGKYGQKLEGVIIQIGTEAGLSKEQITKIKWFDETDSLFKQWKEALVKHHKPEETIEQSSQRVVAAGPSDEELAARAKAAADAATAKAAADAAAAKAAEDAKVPASIRGTEYDPRNLMKLDQDQRYSLAVKGLFALDELKSERSKPSLENIHDKMKETVRRVNKELGTKYPIPTEANPLSDSALQALGERVAMEAGIRGNEESIYQAASGQTHEQLNAAAARGLRALDRTSSGRYDPSDPESAQRLQRNIRKFEREVMGLSRVEADGIADNAMVAALEQALRERGGLAQVTGGQAVVDAASPQSTRATASVETAERNK